MSTPVNGPRNSCRALQAPRPHTAADLEWGVRLQLRAVADQPKPPMLSLLDEPLPGSVAT
jgi:hypothetical protein